MTRRVRRAAHLFFHLSDELLPDITRLLQGEVELVSQTRILATSPATGRELPISLAELGVLAALPADGWLNVEELQVEPEALERLAREGLVFYADEGGELGELCRRDERRVAVGWNPSAALFHSQATWRDVDVRRAFETPLPPLGDPPLAFPSVARARPGPELPLPSSGDGLRRLLVERKTTRNFDPSPLSCDELAALLYYGFGCQGFARVGDDVLLLRKASPSGGSLHPIEVYPLVIAVEGIGSGLYHYRVDRHALDLLEALDEDAARERLVTFVAGQTYLASAQVLFIMTVRFVRSFWKYRAQARAYSVALIDAGHLSQTLYLLCAELGLGAFVSAAVNAGNIEDSLGVDGLEEGVAAVFGCGHPARERSPFDLEFEPYVPRETVIGS